MEFVEGEQNEEISDTDAEDAKMRYVKLLSTAKESFENGESTRRFKCCRFQTLIPVTTKIYVFCI
jgi:hypothetical protein